MTQLVRARRARSPASSDDTIVRVSRQSSSGTYEFFREHVLGKRDFKLGSRDLNGSKEVVELVGSTPDRDRLQRHGLRDAGGQDAEGRLEAGRAGGRADGRRQSTTRPTRSPARSTSTRSASRRGR